MNTVRDRRRDRDGWMLVLSLVTSEIFIPAADQVSNS